MKLISSIFVTCLIISNISAQAITPTPDPTPNPTPDPNQKLDPVNILTKVTTTTTTMFIQSNPVTTTQTVVEPISNTTDKDQNTSKTPSSTLKKLIQSKKSQIKDLNKLSEKLNNQEKKLTSNIQSTKKFLRENGVSSGKNKIDVQIVGKPTTTQYTTGQAEGRIIAKYHVNGGEVYKRVNKNGETVYQFLKKNTEADLLKNSKKLKRYCTRWIVTSDGKRVCSHWKKSFRGGEGLLLEKLVKKEIKRKIYSLRNLYNRNRKKILN